MTSDTAALVGAGMESGGLGLETIIPTEAVTSPVFLGLRLALDLTYGIFLVAGLLRRSAVRGSRHRYTWATVQRAACWPALVFVVMTTARSIGLSQPLGLLLVPVALACWAYTFRQMRADGDDDWFTRAGRRLRRWAASLGTSAHAAPLGVRS